MRYILPLWKLAPFTRLLFPAIAGILAGWYLQIPGWVSSSLAGIGFSGYLCFHFFSTSLLFRGYWLQGLFLMLTVASLFISLTIWADPRSQKSWYGHQHEPEAFVLIVQDQPVIRANYYKTEVIVSEVMANGHQYKTSGMLYLYIPFIEGMNIPQPGNILITKAKLRAIRNRKNPGEFNYARYCALQGVYHTMYAQAGEWKIVEPERPDRFYRFINQLRYYAINCIQKYLPGDSDTRGIAEALMVGYKEDLDKDLLQAYSNVGVVHIIAISGLHLALVYYILSMLISRLPGIKKKVWLQSLLCLLGLWIFALVSGASASVLRSAVMFSFVLTGKSFGYRGPVANSLACSAFFLLSYNPYYLWDPGFLLSYLAVLGIVVLQNPMYRLIYCRDRILRYLWKASTVTLAAQIFTLPLCLYYFHRFPNYFLPANLLAVPLSSAILVAEFLIIAFSWQPAIAFFIGKITGWMLTFMNTVVQFFHSLPGSSTSGIYFSAFTCCLLGVSIIFLGLALQRSRFRHFVYASLFLLLSLIVNICLILRVRKEPVMVVYNFSKQSVIDFFYRGRYFFRGEGLGNQQNMEHYILEPSRIYFASTRQAPGQHSGHPANLINFYNRNILCIDSLGAIPKMYGTTDVLIISHNPAVDMDSLFFKLRPERVVFDASNNLWKIAKWKTICDRLALPCFSIPEQGAFLYYPLRE